MGKYIVSVEERMMLYVQRDANGCWNWTRKKVTGGYGYIKVGRRGYLAHRVAYEFYRRPIHAGMTIDHLCRNRACINPEHLEVVTLAENLRRRLTYSAARNRIIDGVEFCRNGHAFNESNSYWYNSSRSCRACNKVATEAYRARKMRAA